MSLEDLYLTTTVPLPSRPLEIAETDSHGDVCAKLDRLFDDMIRNYPASTRDMLGQIYHEGCNIYLADGLLKEKGGEANWNLRKVAGGYQFMVFVDERIHECPVMQRWAKIHEVGCHIGQADERIDAVTIDRWREENDDQTFPRFTELSAALLDKMIVDAIPQRIFAEDALFTQNADTRLYIAETTARAKLRGYDSYTRLEHRPGATRLMGGVTEADHALLHSRPDVAAFGKLMRKEKPVTARAPTLVP